MTKNLYDVRGHRIAVAWTVEFQRLKARERIPLILLVAIFASEVLRWFI